MQQPKALQTELNMGFSRDASASATCSGAEEAAGAGAGACSWKAAVSGWIFAFDIMETRFSYCYNSIHCL